MTWGIMAMDKFANTDLHYLDYIYIIVYIIKHNIILIY